jgi:geranylgeranyl reductase family protein
MADQFDLIVVGGGPAGASAAWQAAQGGARVLVCDRATFPREKTCGDGITPRSVKLLREMGLGPKLERFRMVRSIRFFVRDGTVEKPWPNRSGFPNHGHVIPRTVLDHMLLLNAAEAGAEVREQVRATSAVIENGAVVGVELLEGGKRRTVRAPITIAADGMTSRIGRAAGLIPSPGPFGVAVRAQLECARPDDAALEVHFTLRSDGDLLPGYGWVFPMEDGRVNIGIGFMNTYRNWRRLNANHLLDEFMRALPRAWALPTMSQLIASKRVQGWRLPMGFTAWPPWRPGILGVGDAIGCAKPLTGSGISKAMESGLVAAATALTCLEDGDVRHLHRYEAELAERWGRFYRLGRGIAHVAGHPRVFDPLVSSAFRLRSVGDVLTAAMTQRKASRVALQGSHIAKSDAPTPTLHDVHTSAANGKGATGAKRRTP